MAHTTKDKEKLLNRVRRIKGQISAIEKALHDDQPLTASWPRSWKDMFAITFLTRSINRLQNKRRPLTNSSTS
jgi:hypothetical protein